MAAAPLPLHKQALLQACLDAGSLTFGSYTLKSGRQSPYFFNAGSLHSGRLLTTLADAFAVAIQEGFGSTDKTSGGTGDTDPGFDVVFGPAYKGIPLACTAVQALAARDPKYGGVSYTFNRKAAKTYGDGGSLVGSTLRGKRVLVVDDVITAGTAIREALDIISAGGGTVVGVVVALDRQERAPSAAERAPSAAELAGGPAAAAPESGSGDDVPKQSAIGLIRAQLGLPVRAVLTLDDIIAGYSAIGTAQDVAALEAYRARYKAED